MIQLCEHELLNFWEVIHQTDDYRLILLPPKMDNLYHSNVGMMIHPRDEAVKLLLQIEEQKQKQENSTSTKPAEVATSAQQYLSLIHI